MYWGCVIIDLYAFEGLAPIGFYAIQLCHLFSYSFKLRIYIVTFILIVRNVILYVLYFDANQIKLHVKQKIIKGAEKQKTSVNKTEQLNNVIWFSASIINCYSSKV